MAVKLINNDLPIAIAEVECWEVLVTFANLVECRVNGRYWVWVEIDKNLVEGSLEMCDHSNLSVFLTDGKNGTVKSFRVVARFDNALTCHASNFRINVILQRLGYRVLFLAPGLAVGWYAYEFDESAPSIVVGGKNVRIADE